MVAAVPRMAISCAMALALQAVIVVSIVLWAIPFGPWRQALLSTVRKLAAVLGDSFVLLEQDIQRATLIQRVRSGLEWLQARTEQTCGHCSLPRSGDRSFCYSGQPVFPKIRGYISVGSGLEKLELLRLVRKDRVGVWPAQLLGLAVLVLVLVALQPLVHWSPDPGWAWLGAAVLMLFIIIFAATFTIEAMKHYEERLESRLSDFRLQTSAVRSAGATSTRGWISFQWVRTPSWRSATSSSRFELPTRHHLLAIMSDTSRRGGSLRRDAGRCCRASPPSFALLLMTSATGASSSLASRARHRSCVGPMAESFDRFGLGAACSRCGPRTR